MKVFRKEIRPRFEIDDKLLSIDQCLDLLKSLKDTMKTSVNNSNYSSNVYLKGTIQECLQFDIVFEVLYNDANDIISFDDSTNLADLILKNLHENLSYKSAILQGYTLMKIDASELSLINDTGDIKTFSTSVCELDKNHKFQKSVTKLLKTIKNTSEIVKFQILNDNNNMVFDIDNKDIPEEISEVFTARVKKMEYECKDVKVTVLKPALSKDKRLTWHVMFKANPPEQHNYIDIETTSINVSLKDEEFHEIIVENEETFKIGDYLICDLYLEVEYYEGTFLGKVKKAKILTVKGHNI